MVVCSKTLVSTQRDKLSLLSRMVVTRSHISLEGTVASVTVDKEVADLFAIERIAREISAAITAEYGAEAKFHV